MAIDKTTPLGEITGFYRTVIVAAFKTYRKALKKAQKSEEDIDGDTSHLDERTEIVEEFEAALDARTVRSMADTPIGQAIAEGEARASVHPGYASHVDGNEPSLGLEVIEWSDRGPWAVIAIDEKGDEVVRNDPSENGQRPIVAYTLDWMWEAEPEQPYNLEHDTEAEAMVIAAERNKAHAAALEMAAAVDARATVINDLPEPNDVEGYTPLRELPLPEWERASIEEPKQEEAPKKAKKRLTHRPAGKKRR